MKSVAVIGAGQMGSGIAQVAAAAGHRVLLSDRDLDLAQKAKDEIGKRLARQVERAQTSAGDAAALLDRIEPVTGYAIMAEADLVIEAATEREAIKTQIFEGVGPHLHDQAILSSNTSSIPITRLAKAAPDPARFIGLHFFIPVPMMELVEIIPGLATSEATINAVRRFGEGLGKQMILSADSPGFVVNRMLLPMLNEAIFGLGEGLASMADIDKGCRLGLGHDIGPLELADFIGLDTCLDIINVLHETTGDPKFRPAPLLARYVAAGWLGRKTGRGFYDYRGGGRTPTR